MAITKILARKGRLDVGIRYVPVSYTHLDVYKRQRVCQTGQGAD